MHDPKGADRVERGFEATLGAEAGYSRPFGCLDCRGEAGLPHRFGELELSRIHPLMVAQARRVTCWTPRRSQPVKGSALDIFHPGGPPVADRETSAGWVAVASDRDMGSAHWGPRSGRALDWLTVSLWRALRA